jgi:hypothetical protein
MWRLTSVAAKRERNTVIAAKKKFFQQHVGTLHRSLSSVSTDSSPDVACQLDYYMSLQFAGVACALVNGKCLVTMNKKKILRNE